jgi:nucleotide-binding universal stress UspA family protein
VDGFESSKAALRWAIHQAKLTGAVVDAVTTWHIPPGSELVPAVDMPDYQDDARIILTEAITEMCMIDTDVVVRPRVVEGQAGPVLAEAAEGADLLVVGNRGHGGLAEALLGSVGQYCVRHAPCRATPRRWPRSPRRAAWSHSSPWSAWPRAGRTPHSGRRGRR